MCHPSGWSSSARFTSPVLQRCPHRGATELFKNSPDIFYTTGDRGHWVVASATLARGNTLRQPDKFSSDPVHNPANARKPPTLPNQSDPPLHTELRRIINPFSRLRACRSWSTRFASWLASSLTR